MNRPFVICGGGVAVAIILTACASEPAPNYSGDPAIGREVAKTFCSSCHSIETIGGSPNPGAPPLRYVLADRDAAQLARDFDNAVTISHLRMPTFYFDDRHPYDLVAYIKTIQQPPQPLSN